MISISYQALSIGGERKDRYAIFKNFSFVPLGKMVICNLNNDKKIPIKWISYQIIAKGNGKVLKAKYLHFFEKPVILDGYILKTKNKNHKLFRKQCAASVIEGVKTHGSTQKNALSRAQAIQFTA